MTNEEIKKYLEVEIQDNSNNFVYWWKNWTETSEEDGKEQIYHICVEWREKTIELIRIYTDIFYNGSILKSRELRKQYIYNRV